MHILNRFMTLVLPHFCVSFQIKKQSTNIPAHEYDLQHTTPVKPGTFTIALLIICHWKMNPETVYIDTQTLFTAVYALCLWDQSMPSLCILWFCPSGFDPISAFLVSNSCLA